MSPLYINLDENERYILMEKWSNNSMFVKLQGKYTSIQYDFKI